MFCEGVALPVAGETCENRATRSSLLSTFDTWLIPCRFSVLDSLGDFRSDGAVLSTATAQPLPISARVETAEFKRLRRLSSPSPEQMEHHVAGPPRGHQTKAVKTNSFVRQWLSGHQPHDPLPDDILGLRGCNMIMIDEVRERRRREEQTKARLLAARKKRKFKAAELEPELLAMLSVTSVTRIPDENGRYTVATEVMVGFDVTDSFTVNFTFNLRYRTENEVQAEQIMPITDVQLGWGAAADLRRQRIGFLLSQLGRDALAQMRRFTVNPDGTSREAYVPPPPTAPAVEAAEAVTEHPADTADAAMSETMPPAEATE